MPAGPLQVASNQAQTFLRIWSGLAAHLRKDRALPARLERTLKQNPRFGSRDRRLYRELTYTALRYLPWLEQDLASPEGTALSALVWLAADLPATQAVKKALTEGWPSVPQRVVERAAVLKTLASDSLNLDSALLPDWFRAECPEAFDSPLYDVLQTRAPLWLRLQTDDLESVGAEFHQRGWHWDVSPVLPTAWRIHGDVDVTQTRAFQTGAIEVQDLGSQLVLESVGVAAGEHWLDACAGAGGKTLQLARLVGDRGRVTAHDIRAEALAELRHRSARAGSTNITIASSPQGEFDGVLVDAPCSGTGTWRRSPHLKWSTTPSIVEDMTRIQGALLDSFATMTRAGGRLVYATCSLCRGENETVAREFLRRRPDFQPVMPRPLAGLAPLSSSIGLSIYPSVFDTDGYYIASFRRVV